MPAYYCACDYKNINCSLNNFGVKMADLNFVSDRADLSETRV